MSLINDYIASSRKALMSINETEVLRLATAIRAVWAKDSQVLLCGNGGSSANAVHLCADLIYGICSFDIISINYRRNRLSIG